MSRLSTNETSELVQLINVFLFKHDVADMSDDPLIEESVDDMLDNIYEMYGYNG